MGNSNELESVFNAALKLLEFGWAPLPLVSGTKTPKVKGFTRWKHPPSETAIRKWFSKPSGLGVVLGPVSGGLGVMDFDTADGFHDWQEQHPDIAETAPRSRTRRGHQVFFATTDRSVEAVTGSKARAMHGDGADLKYNGLVVIPPSLHPSGVTYTWEVDPFGGVPFIADIGEAGLIPPRKSNATVTKSLPEFSTEEMLQKSSRPAPAPPSTDFLNIGELGSRVKEAIRQTIPDGEGQRNGRIFEFCRRLKTMPELADKKPTDLKDFAYEWYLAAYPRIRTKEFAETWKDFLNAWDCAKHPLGATITAIFEQTKGEGPERLMNLCELLQKIAGNDSFYLDNRTAARLLGIHWTTANRWLRRMIADGVLLLVDPHNWKEKHATRYHFKGR